LYRFLENNKKTEGKVKLIGIGIGTKDDDINYIKYFEKLHKVPYPLFPDKGFVIRKQVRSPDTPFFMGVNLKEEGNNKIFYTQLGPVKQADKFLKLIIEKSDLK
jgi:hypothetical protein